MAENTREIVLETLLSLEREEEFSHRLLKAVLDKYDYLESRDKAFIKRVTEGTIERQLELDYYLDVYSSVPVRKMKPLIRCLLRMSVYQILYMDAVPDSAICNEACKLAEKRRFRNLKGFVNGVLRHIANDKTSLPLPDEKKNPTEYISVKYSMPRWLVNMWLDEYGKEGTVTLLEGLLQIHPVSLRFKSTLSGEEREAWVAKLQSAGAQLKQSAYLPYVYTGTNIEGISTLPGFSEGVFTVQDVSSALAVSVAGIKEGDFVMDICAAPGGKSILAAEKAGRVLSRDVSESKIAVIGENLERMQVSNVTTQVYDATVTDTHYTEQADVLIMDVPCSGLGVMGKKRDIKYHASPENIESIVELQRMIVQNSWQYVKPCGILLYSTCTINRAENEDMVRWMAEQLPLEPVSIRDCLPEKILAADRAIREQVQKPSGLTKELDDACMQLLPGYMDADGFFFAKFRRK